MKNRHGMTSAADTIPAGKMYSRKFCTLRAREDRKCRDRVISFCVHRREVEAVNFPAFRGYDGLAASKIAERERGSCKVQAEQTPIKGL